MTPDLAPVLPGKTPPPVPNGFSKPIYGKLRCPSELATFDIIGWFDHPENPHSWVQHIPMLGDIEAWWSLRLGSPIARANGIGGEPTSDPCESESPKPEEGEESKPESPIIIMTAGGVSEYRSHPDFTPGYHGGFMSPERAQKLESALAAARATITSLRAALEWQPIETAPRDGTFIDLWGTDITSGWSGNGKPRRHTRCRWIEGDGGFNGRWWHSSEGRIDATHWRSIPDSPEVSPASSGKGEA